MTHYKQIFINMFNAEMGIRYSPHLVLKGDEEYLSAELREGPNSMGAGMRTQADQLPTFMKLGKNREKIVKLLQQMQKNNNNNS